MGLFSKDHSSEIAELLKRIEKLERTTSIYRPSGASAYLMSPLSHHRAYEELPVNDVLQKLLNHLNVRVDRVEGTSPRLVLTALDTVKINKTKPAR